MRHACRFAVAAVLLAPSLALAQRYPTRRTTITIEHHRDNWLPRQLSLNVGAFRYDVTDENFPMAALRADWPLSRYVRSELSASYSLAKFDRTTTTATPTTQMNSSLMAGTIGVQGELPFEYVRPYAGAAIGLFGRIDEKGGERYWRPTTAFPIGVRIPFPSGIGIRAEGRFRFDQQRGGGSAVDVEQTVGLSFVF